MKTWRAFLGSLFCATIVSCHQPPVKAPSDFAFLLRTSTTTADALTLNTFDKTLQRVTKSADTTVSFQLTGLQLDSVYVRLEEMDFFSLPEYLEPEGGIMVFPSPWTSFRVRANGVTKRVRFGGSFTSGVLAIENLRHLREHMLEMIVDSPQYKILLAQTAR